MRKTINVGGENFIRLRQSGSYYVDKTEIIYDLFHETNNSVTLFTRPRRFGKTLMMNMITSFFDIEKKNSKITELMNDLWNGNDSKASEILSALLWKTISYMDYSEDYYHAFLTGIFVGRGGYEVESNKEHGTGRPDIIIKDQDNRRAIVIEAKRSDSEERMEYWCHQALKQIDEKEYAEDLDGYRKILRYSISFWKKEALVKGETAV